VGKQILAEDWQEKEGRRRCKHQAMQAEEIEKE